MMNKETMEHEISDEIWRQIKPLLPPEPVGKYPQMDSRKAIEAIFYIIHTGCEWDEVPARLGSGDEIYNRFLEWSKTGAFERMWQVGTITYDELRKLVFSL
jgi:putative transposase